MEKCYEKKICKESSLLRSGGCYGLVLAGPAAGSRAMAADTKLTIKEAQINQLLTGDLTLPDSIDGAPDAKISYSVGDANPAYVSVKGNKLKVTRPYAGKGNYKFTLTDNGHEWK